MWYLHYLWHKYVKHNENTAKIIKLFHARALTPAKLHKQVVKSLMEEYYAEREEAIYRDHRDEHGHTYD